jgi:hypothetical protein
VSRAPAILIGTLLFAVFGFHSCLILVREPSHPRAEPVEDDYPLETGMTWVYKGPWGVQGVRRVEWPQGKGGLGWLDMHFEFPALGRKSLTMRRTRDGVEALRDGHKQLIMRFPMKSGDSWTIDFPDEDLAECTVLEPEEIEVLGRRARASKLQVVRTNRKTGKQTTDFEWYVRGIGLARMEVTFGLKANFILSRFEKSE